MRRLAAIKRGDQRLGNRCGPVKGARVAPGFEVMGFGQMPMAQARRLVLIKAQVTPERHTLKALAKAEIGWGGEYRITAKDDENLHFVRIDRIRQIG